jgi:hypothetical protein
MNVYGTRMNQRWAHRQARVYLKFIGVIEFTRPKKFLAHDFDHAVFQLFLEGKVFTGGVQFVQQFATSRAELTIQSRVQTSRTLLLIMWKSEFGVRIVTTNSHNQRKRVEIASQVSRS